MKDPWAALLDEAPAVADPWAVWDVAWEDVSKPLGEAVRLRVETHSPDTKGEGWTCAVCGGTLRLGDWAVDVLNRRHALVHAGRLWRRCYA